MKCICIGGVAAVVVGIVYLACTSRPHALYAHLYAPVHMVSARAVPVHATTAFFGGYRCWPFRALSALDIRHSVTL